MGAERTLANVWWLRSVLNRKFGKSWWIFAVMMIIFLAVDSSTFRQYVRDVLNVPDGDAPGGDDTPFWFMRYHVVDGVRSGAKMVLCLLLVALTWKHYPRISSMALVMAWIWCMPRVVDALIIYWRSSDLMDARRAVSEWKTFDEWLTDPIRRVSSWATSLSSLPLAYFLGKRYGWWQPEEGSDATALFGPD